MSRRRIWIRRVLIAGLVVLAGEQAWRHGRDYVFADRFAVVEPGRLFRGAWQQPWPMRRLVRDYHIKTVVALAHPADNPLAVREKALSQELGFRWIHIPIVDDRTTTDGHTLYEQLDRAADALADPANQPVYFHCHHGINRTSMTQMAYRMKHCGWTLEQASREISESFGLVEVSKGPDYRFMSNFYRDRILPAREAQARAAQAATLR